MQLTGEASQLAICQSVVEDLNSGLPRTNATGGQGGTYTAPNCNTVRNTILYFRDKKKKQYTFASLARKRISRSYPYVYRRFPKVEEKKCEI